jgi:hypothetical protein
LGNSGEYFGVGDQQSFGKKNVWNPLEKEFTDAGYSKQDAKNYFLTNLGGGVSYLNPDMWVSGETINDIIGNTSATLAAIPGGGYVVKGIVNQGAK